MKDRLFALGLAAIFALACATTANATEPSDVVAELSASKVVTGPDGETLLVPADEIRPGEVVQYQAVYRNAGDAQIQHLAPVLPVPLGLEYLPNSAEPAQVSASLDGRRFAPVPLRRRVTLPDGRDEWREVPYAEYRFLRWQLGDLPPAESAVVRARMRVIPLTAPVSAGPLVTR
jgi:hypothetical protein